MNNLPESEWLVDSLGAALLVFMAFACLTFCAAGVILWSLQ